MRLTVLGEFLVQPKGIANMKGNGGQNWSHSSAIYLDKKRFQGTKNRVDGARTCGSAGELLPLHRQNKID